MLWFDLVESSNFQDTTETKLPKRGFQSAENKCDSLTRLMSTFLPSESLSPEM